MRYVYKYDICDITRSWMIDTASTNYEFFMTTIKSMFTSVHRNIHLESKHLKYHAIYSTVCFKVFIKRRTSYIHYHVENITDVCLSTICLCQK